jgi:hypothetical protein
MKNKGYSTLSVYKNSLVLRDLSDALAHYFSHESGARTKKTLGLRAIIAESLVTDASLLPVTIEKACKSSSLNNRLQSMTFINIITKNIISYCNGLENDGVKEKEYLQLLRKELKTFRKSFKKWRKSLVNDQF